MPAHPTGTNVLGVVLFTECPLTSTGHCEVRRACLSPMLTIYLHTHNKKGAGVVGLRLRYDVDGPAAADGELIPGGGQLQRSGVLDVRLVVDGPPFTIKRITRTRMSSVTVSPAVDGVTMLSVIERWFMRSADSV